MKAVVVFGVGVNAEHNFDRIVSNYCVVAVTDNDMKTWGEEWHGYKICSPEEALGSNYDFVYITSGNHYTSIKEQLIDQYGISDYRIIGMDKCESELAYWLDCYREEKVFHNEHYKELMLGIADATDDGFWKNRVVADFGCGPRGSLAWTNSPCIKIGIDILVPRYLKEFDLKSHGMVYVTSSEDGIPMADESVDYLLTLNSLDHVLNLEVMTKELLRILKKGGTLLGSFNLYEAASDCEPQTLTEELLDKALLSHFEEKSYKLALRDVQGGYKYMRSKQYIERGSSKEEQTLWYKGIKK